MNIIISKEIQNLRIVADVNKKLLIALNVNETSYNFLSKLQTVNIQANILKLVTPYNLAYTENYFSIGFTNMFEDEYVFLRRQE